MDATRATAIRRISTTEGAEPAAPAGKPGKDVTRMDPRIARVVFPVHGLACGGGGALTAERALTRTPGVLRAYVNPATEMAYVEFDYSTTTTKELARAMADAGLHAGEPVLR